MGHVTRRRSAHHTIPARDFDIIADGNLPLIPAGVYDAVGGRAQHPRVIFNTLKLYVPFVVLVPNHEAPSGFDRVRLYRHYNVHTAPDRRFRVRSTSAYWREWVLATARRPGRHDRLSPHVFDGVLFAIEVRTVNRDREQHDLPQQGRYSVVGRIIERKAGGPQL